MLAGAPIEGNIFYHLCPTPLLLPLVILATVATVVASQAVITGAFSMTRQAIQLGLLPRLQIIQTSAEGYGQIYLPTVNWLLMVVTLGISIGSEAQAASPLPMESQCRRRCWQPPFSCLSRCARFGAGRCRP